MSNPIAREIKAVLFDADNTLLASNAFMVRHLKKTLRRLAAKGIPRLPSPSEAEIMTALASNVSFEEFFKILFKGKHRKRELWEIVLEDYRTDSTKEPIPPTPGAIEAIAALRRLDIVIGIVSNRTAMLQERLAQAGFDANDFAFLCQPELPEHHKPHPLAFDKALRQLKARGIHPEQVVMFGDHPHDYYPAYYQNVKFMGVLQGATNREEFFKHYNEHDLLIKDLTNIEEKLSRLVNVIAYRSSIANISAADGRHATITFPLRHYFSEYALHRYRMMVEVEHLIALSELFKGKIIRALKPKEKESLRRLYMLFSPQEGYEVLQYDHLNRSGAGPAEHDVKSCELWLGEKISGTSMEDLRSSLHLFVTSEDINNAAYKLMLSDAANGVLVPAILQIMERLAVLARTYQNDPVMSRTHMQPASPTTFGKIFSGYLARLVEGMERLGGVMLAGKLNGAVGNYNAFVAAYPAVDWMEYSRKFMDRLGLQTELITDQRGPHADMIRAFQAIQEINNVLRDLATDLSLYAGLGTMAFEKVESHVGSSVMPHKVNPWFAEVSEGNATKANYLINCLANELDVSRLQRDLSDHDYERSYGETIGYVLVAIEHLYLALVLVKPQCTFARKELKKHPEIVTEALQTILRKYGNADAYNLLKSAFRGKTTTVEELQSFVKKLKASATCKKELFSALHPETYTGLASQLTQHALDRFEQWKKQSVRYLSEARGV